MVLARRVAVRAGDTMTAGLSRRELDGLKSRVELALIQENRGTPADRTAAIMRRFPWPSVLAWRAGLNVTPVQP